MRSNVDVLVVGAGPTGLTLACVLARFGVSTLVVERNAGPFAGSRAKGVQPRTLEVLDQLGVVDRALAGGESHLPMRLYDAAGGWTDRDVYARERGGDGVPYAAPLLIPQWRTDAILRDAFVAAGGAVTYATSLEYLAQDEGGVTATLTTPSGTRTVRAGWVAGCDGGGSTVRRQAGIDFLGTTDETTRMFVADVRATGVDRGHWHLWRTERTLFGLAPFVASDLFQLQASPDDDMPGEPTLEVLQTLTRRRTGRDDILLSGPSWLSAWRLNVRMVNRYRAGRVLLAGDACHVHPPAGGQGMNTGIQDAWNLGWKLAAVVGGAPSALLDSFEAERLPVAAHVLGVSTALLPDVFRGDNWLLKHKFDPRQLDIRYPDSPLTRDDRVAPGAVRAGDRAPDATGLVCDGVPCRLFDLLRGPRWTLLAFGAGWEACITTLPPSVPCERRVIVPPDRTPAPGAVLDAGGRAHANYDVSRPTLVLVRPDGYVGLCLDRQDASLAQYGGQFSRPA